VGEGEKSGRGVCVEGKKCLAWLVDWWLGGRSFELYKVKKRRQKRTRQNGALVSGGGVYDAWGKERRVGGECVWRARST
jgi:hypothetical protein